MQISVTVTHASDDAGLSADFVSLDVSPDFTLDILKGLIEADINASKDAQILKRDGQTLSGDDKTLAELGVTEADILELVVQTRQTQQPQRPQAQQQRQSQGGQPSAEQIRQRMLTNADFMQGVQRQDPELAAAVNDSARFQTIYDERLRRLLEAQRQADADIDNLDNDIWNPNAQAEIEKRIKAQQISKNLELAMEENPESFARVSMLYIDVTVNNVPIKAFVDSGAQTTIMSPDAARRCNITHLIDERYGGIARGVGTAKIVGRVHHAYMLLGGYQAASSFTVMEGKDVDLLLGLDMLKRHQMCIDLRENCLRVQDAKIEFLPEHQIPKMMEEVLENEPKVEGPEGATIGAETGTVEGPPRSQAGASLNTQASTSSTQPAAARAAPAPSQPQTRPQPQQGSVQPRGQLGFGRTQQVTEDSIQAVMQFGIPREQAIQLLEQAGGNPDLAMGLLFG